MVALAIGSGIDTFRKCPRRRCQTSGLNGLESVGYRARMPAILRIPAVAINMKFSRAMVIAAAKSEQRKQLRHSTECADPLQATNPCNVRTRWKRSFAPFLANNHFYGNADVTACSWPTFDLTAMTSFGPGHLIVCHQ